MGERQREEQDAVDHLNMDIMYSTAPSGVPEGCQSRVGE